MGRLRLRVHPFRHGMSIGIFALGSTESARTLLGRDCDRSLFGVAFCKHSASRIKLLAFVIRAGHGHLAPRVATVLKSTPSAER